MNRHQRRAGRIRDPKGNPLDVYLVEIRERDHLGRPTVVRILYDEERAGDAFASSDPVCTFGWFNTETLTRSS